MPARLDIPTVSLHDDVLTWLVGRLHSVVWTTALPLAGWPLWREEVMHRRCTTRNENEFSEELKGSMRVWYSDRKGREGASPTSTHLLTLTIDVQNES